MGTERILEYPFTREKIAELDVGDLVLVKGRVFAGRDRLHKYLFDGGKIPVDLKDGAVFHCGPVVVRQEGSWQVRAAGPTTSVRQESYMPAIIGRHRVRVIIGKGGMGEGTRNACSAHGCVYLHAVGGAACVLAQRIAEVTGVHFMKEFGSTEALWEFVADGLPAVVTIDSKGRSLHRRVANASRRQRNALLRDTAFAG